MVKLVVDMMGGDNGSSVTCEAVLEYLKKSDDVYFYCVGKKEELTSLLNNDKIEIIDAKDVLPMESGAMDALRNNESSMMKACLTLLEKEADGIVSCGSTAAYLTSTAVKFKKIPGISRPALVAPFPTIVKGKQVTILDIGASNENSPEELVQFSLMGSLYSKHVLGVENPNIYLLSNGAEEGKGSPTSKAAYELLKNNQNFKGNIEAREALHGAADVIVADGFSGNIFLKSNEGMAKIMSNMIKSSFKRNIFSKIGYLLSRKGFDEFSEAFDYKSTGGAMLLGINRVVVKAHGNSDAYSFRCAIDVAYKLAKQDIVNKIKEGLHNA